MMPKNKIMFVCTGNTCRSPMAEAVFNRFAEEKGLTVRAESMGTTTVTGMPVSESLLKTLFSGEKKLKKLFKISV